MKIRILGERLIAFNGLVARACADGSEHDVVRELGETLIRDGWAELKRRGKETKEVVPPANQAQPSLPDVTTPAPVDSAPADDSAPVDHAPADHATVAAGVRQYHAEGAAAADLAEMFAITIDEVAAILADDQLGGA